MHAWADISHKLSYKKKEHVPELFQRNLFQLSALFEIADDRFEMLRAERENYRNSMINNGQFNLDQKLNLDSLQAFLDFHFPDRVKDMDDTIELLDELMKYSISLEHLNESYNKVKDLLTEFEEEVFFEENMDRDIDDEENRWTQCGTVRHLLELTNDHYWEDRCIEFKDIPNNQIGLTQTQRHRVKKF